MAIEKVLEFKLKGKEAAKELERINDILEEQEDITIKLQLEQQKLEQQLKNTPKNALAAQKDLRDELDHVKDSLKDQSLSVKELKLEQKGLKKQTTELVNEQKQGIDVVNQLASITDKYTGGAVSKFQSFRKGQGGIIKGFKSMKLAIASTGIGLLIVAIGSLATAFKSSEEGQNTFNKIMGVIGAVTSQFRDVIANLGEKIISAFQNPKKAIQDFVTLIKENIVNRFTGLLELIPQLGKAIGLLFKGEFKEAGTVAANAAAKVTLGVDDIVGKLDKATEATGRFIEKTKESARIAARIADDRAKADKLERDLIVERAKADRERADLLEKSANRERFTAAERIAFLREAARVDEEITNKEIEAAQIRLETKQAENNLSKSTKEDKDEEAKLEAELINLQTARLRKQKEVTGQIGALVEQENARKKAAADQDKKTDEERTKAAQDKIDADTALEIKRKQFDAQRIQDEVLKLEALKALDLEEQELHRQKLQRVIELAAVDSQARIDAQIALDAFNEEARQKNIETDEAIKGKEIELKDKEQTDRQEAFDQKVADAEAERELDKQKIRNKGKVVDALSQFAGAETGIGKALLIAKQALALQETLMDVKRITFKGTKAVAEAGVDAAQNVSESSKIGFPQNLITIAAAIGQGVGIISSVKKAVSKTGAATGGAGASTPSIPTPALPPSRPPSFNIVGSTGTNQLAEVINSQTGQQTAAIDRQTQTQTEAISSQVEQSSQPIKAYVVGSEVSGQQELDRKTTDEAKLT